MKRTLTDADKMELSSKLRDRFAYDTTHVPHAVIDTAIQVFSEFYESKNSFSDLVKDGTAYSKICPTCDQTFVIYPFSFRGDALWSLRILARNAPMTFKELADVKIAAGLDPKYAKDATRHIGEAKYWNLVEETEEIREGCSVYAITEKGRLFVKGELPVPEKIWVHAGERFAPPSGETDGEEKYIDEMPSGKYADKEAIWAESVSAFQS